YGLYVVNTSSMLRNYYSDNCSFGIHLENSRMWCYSLICEGGRDVNPVINTFIEKIGNSRLVIYGMNMFDNSGKGILIKDADGTTRYNTVIYDGIFIGSGTTVSFDVANYGAIRLINPSLGEYTTPIPNNVLINDKYDSYIHAEKMQNTVHF